MGVKIRNAEMRRAGSFANYGVSAIAIASAMVAAIGDHSAFSKGRDFGAWLGLVPKQISTGDRTICRHLVGAERMVGPMAGSRHTGCHARSGLCKVAWQ
jgi:hypothetical protein